MASNINEDEALARRLQLEEQQSGTFRRGHPRSPVGNSYAQDLPQRFMQMDIRQQPYPSPRSGEWYARPMPSPRSPYGSDYPMSPQGMRPFDGMRYHMGHPVIRPPPLGQFERDPRSGTPQNDIRFTHQDTRMALPPDQFQPERKPPPSARSFHQESRKPPPPFNSFQHDSKKPPPPSQALQQDGMSGQPLEQDQGKTTLAAASIQQDTKKPPPAHQNPPDNMKMLPPEEIDAKPPALDHEFQPQTKEPQPIDQQEPDAKMPHTTNEMLLHQPQHLAPTRLPPPDQFQGPLPPAQDQYKGPLPGHYQGPPPGPGPYHVPDMRRPLPPDQYRQGVRAPPIQAEMMRHGHPNMMMQSMHGRMPPHAHPHSLSPSRDRSYMEYARQLQERAFIDLHHSPRRPNRDELLRMQQQSSTNDPHPRHFQTDTSLNEEHFQGERGPGNMRFVRDDRMQNFRQSVPESRMRARIVHQSKAMEGPGHNRFHTETTGFDNLNALPVPQTSQLSPSADQKLARFVQETGASINELPSDLIKDILAASTSEEQPERLETRHQPTLERFIEETGASINDLPNDLIKDILAEANNRTEEVSQQTTVDTMAPSNSQPQLVRFIEETGTNISEIPSDLMNDILSNANAGKEPTSEPMLVEKEIPSSTTEDPNPVESHPNHPGEPPSENPTKTPEVKDRKAYDPQTAQSDAVTRSPVTPSKTMSLSATAPLVGEITPKSQAHKVNGKDLEGARLSKENNASAMVTPLKDAKKKKKRGFLKFSRSLSRSDDEGKPSDDVVAGIPSAIPPRPAGLASPLKSPHRKNSLSFGSFSPTGTAATVPTPVPPPPPPITNPSQSASTMCAVCGDRNGPFLAALGKKFHPSCFRCGICNELIDHTAGEFKVMTHPRTGEKVPRHLRCSAMPKKNMIVQCVACQTHIKPSEDGTIQFFKHPFFEERVCLRHASQARRCTGCQRFEPSNAPFIDLNDSGRGICFACFRTVVVDGKDAEPLWQRVLKFFEHYLRVPVWGTMEDIAILIVPLAMVKDQLKLSGTVHKMEPPFMTGLCLTEKEHSRRLKLSSLRFDSSTRSFETQEEYGYTDLAVPKVEKARVFAIMSVSGLPRDLTAGILAHEATHAWIKLHPKYDASKPIPPQVEEGCAQLVAMLFLSDGLDPLPEDQDARNLQSDDDDDGPSDEKLRQYFKYNIERADDNIFGTGYRKAAMAYREIGVEALLNHVVLHQDFPHT